MLSLVNVLLATATVVSGSALPANLNNRNADGTVSINQVANPKYKFNGALSVYKTYLKFGVPAPEHLQAAVANLTGFFDNVDKRATGSVTATPIDASDDAYVCPVSIGTPPQTLNLDFDTGSSDLWVFSSFTPASQVNGQKIYTPSKSSTSSLLSGYSWSISYGDGSSSDGTVYDDTVTIGGFTVPKQAIEVASKVSSSFTSDSATDGLVGLGFDSLNTVSPRAQGTFFDNAKKTLPSPLFTADLKYKAAGKYNFGYIDTSAYTGSITYTPVNTNPGYWTFSSSGYGVGSTFKSTTITGIADTGTTLLYLPSSVVSAYYSKVSGAVNSNTYGGYIFPCASTLPTFTFGVGAARITIPAKYLDFGEVSTGSSYCFGGLQSSAGVGINIFGDVALKAAFVVFNGGSTPSLGWASKKLT